MLNLNLNKNMILSTTAKGTKVNVSLCNDIGENRGDYYCEVYLEGMEDFDPIDNFVIHTDDLVNYCRVEDAVYEYINGVTEY